MEKEKVKMIPYSDSFGCFVTFFIFLLFICILGLAMVGLGWLNFSNAALFFIAVIIFCLIVIYLAVSKFGQKGNNGKE